MYCLINDVVRERNGKSEKVIEHKSWNISHVSLTKSFYTLKLTKCEGLSRILSEISNDYVMIYFYIIPVSVLHLCYRSNYRLRLIHIVVIKNNQPFMVTIKEF